MSPYRLAPPTETPATISKWERLKTRVLRRLAVWWAHQNAPMLDHRNLWRWVKQRKRGYNRRPYYDKYPEEKNKV